MEGSNYDIASAYDGSRDEFLSLAFDCTRMVTQLSQGVKLESQGDHESAMSLLENVETRIDTWIEKLEDLDTEGVDKKELFRDLEGAREAIRVDSFE